MGFFIYRQNNSGGSFIGPALIVGVTAPDAATADRLASEHGVYFDGAGDCDCCGTRWQEASDPGTFTMTWGAKSWEYTVEPDTMADALEQAEDMADWSDRDNVPPLLLLAV